MHGSMMAKKSRYREPNGRPQRENVPAPTAVRRLRDAALTEMRFAEWGTELGRLRLADHLTDSMYAAGKKWAEMASKYQRAIGVFPVKTSSPQVGRNGSPADPDTPEGERVARREANNAEEFFKADAVLVAASAQGGPNVRLTVRRVCEDNESPCGIDELMALRTGLMHLVSHWNLTNAGKSDRANVNSRS